MKKTYKSKEISITKPPKIATKETTIIIRSEIDLKNRFQAYCKAKGVTMSYALNDLMKQQVTLK